MYTTILKVSDFSSDSSLDASLLGGLLLILIETRIFCPLDMPYNFTVFYLSFFLFSFSFFFILNGLNSFIFNQRFHLEILDVLAARRSLQGRRKVIRIFLTTMCVFLLDIITIEQFSSRMNGNGTLRGKLCAYNKSRRNVKNRH